MVKRNLHIATGLVLIAIVFMQACQLPANHKMRKENRMVPKGYSYTTNDDTTKNSATIKWKEFYTDPNLVALIDSALVNNQELNIIMYEILVAQNEIRARKGEYLPFLGAGAGGGVEKVGRYTSQGANDANTNIMPGKAFPDPLPNVMAGVYASWELDIWKKLRNAKKSAYMRYLSTNEGKNFMVTNLVAEIANTYYELMALDNQLEILSANIEIQTNALEIVKLQKTAAMVTELAVRKFEAEVLKNKSRQYYIKQAIVEAENHINFLVGRYPQPVQRSSKDFPTLVPQSIYSGVPSQVMENRTDIRQATYMLEAAKLDVKSAKANFYPSLRLTGGLGFQAFNPQYLLTTPESMLYNIAGDLVAPLINRNAIKAMYYNANARQMQAVYRYEQTVLNAYVEVVNQLSMINNLKSAYEMKEKQVEALSRSIDISIGLFKSARADYMEVLMTQRDALEAKMELIETKRHQLNAMVNVYQALGGGWN